MTDLPCIKYGYERIENLDVFYKEAGLSNESTLVFLPGFPYSPAVTNEFINQLSDYFHVISPDYPGFGNSSAPSPLLYNYSLDNLAAAVMQFITAKGLRDYTIFAQDLGGEIGLRVAAESLGTVSSIVLNNWKEQLIYKPENNNEYSLIKHNALKTTNRDFESPIDSHTELEPPSFGKISDEHNCIIKNLFNTDMQPSNSVLASQIIKKNIPVITTHYTTSDSHISDTYHLINSYKSLTDTATTTHSKKP